MTRSPDTPDDRRLVGAYLERRDEGAFLALYDRHTTGLFRFAARLAGGPGAEAEELVQESWIRALEALPRFRWESSLRTWLCGFVLNGWRNRRSRVLRETRLALVVGGREGDEPGPEAGADPATGRAVERALEGLPDGYRAVLLLHDLEGYTHEEIARALGITAGTSKSQLHRARRVVRRRLLGETEVTREG